MSQNITVDEKPPQANRRVWTQRGIVDSKCERERNDLYKTPSFAVDELLKYETFHHRVWEPACGTGNISEPLIRHGYEVRSTDLIDRGYGTGGIDFLGCKEPWDGDIVTNPPYSISNEFVVHALELVEDGRKVCMLLRLQHLEGKKDIATFLPKIRHKRCMFLSGVCQSKWTGIRQKMTVQSVMRGSCGKKDGRVSRLSDGSIRTKFLQERRTFNEKRVYQ